MNTNTIKHQKHTKIARPDVGEFGRNEWAILGTVCNDIKAIAYQVIDNLQSDFNLAYIDADHQSAENVTGTSKNATSFGATLEYTDKISFHRFDEARMLNKFQFRQYFNSQDGILINGNHFTGQQQIVVIDERKEQSLKKKLDRLTNVRLFILTENQTEIYSFLKNHLPNWQRIPTLSIKDSTAITSFIKQGIEANKPAVHGLVLAGGKSQRMGYDKGLINYHGKPQREYLYDLLGGYCDKVYMSCRPEQAETLRDFSLIPDTFHDLGPFGGILSAFRQNPNVAWLVVACDLPFLDKAAIQELLDKHNYSNNATAFYNESTGFPEPLITIWQPRSYPVLLQYLAQGYSCPRKVLINSAINLVYPSRPEVLKNINHPQEAEEVLMHFAKLDKEQ